LTRPSAEDRKAIEDASDRALTHFDDLIAGKLEAVMKALHTEASEKS
jgi:peptidyl-tRNA hydrolase